MKRMKYLSEVCRRIGSLSFVSNTDGCAAPSTIDGASESLSHLAIGCPAQRDLMPYPWGAVMSYRHAFCHCCLN